MERNQKYSPKAQIWIDGDESKIQHLISNLARKSCGNMKYQLPSEESGLISNCMC